MAKRQKVWVYSPPKQKPSQSKIPDTLKAEVTTKANQFIDSVLKPTYVKPPPENPQFNYMVDISSKWYHSSFYFYSTYCVPGPNALSPRSEERRVGKECRSQRSY